jgi:hypothetical protein
MHENDRERETLLPPDDESPTTVGNEKPPTAPLTEVQVFAGIVRAEVKAAVAEALTPAVGLMREALNAALAASHKADQALAEARAVRAEVTLLRERFEAHLEAAQ